MNKIKAILHNEVLYKLSHKENGKYHKIIVDEFTSPKSYFSYLKQENFEEKINIKELNREVEEIVKKENVLRTELDKIIRELEVVYGE